MNRYKKVYSDLEISELKIDFTKPEKEEKVKEATISYPFSAKMNSVAGPIAFDHPATLIKEKKDDGENWYIDWDTTYIFPQLEPGDKISLSEHSSGSRRNSRSEWKSLGRKWNLL